MPLVFSQVSYIATNPSTFTPSTAPTAGNLLVISAHTRAAADKLLGISGWTIIEAPIVSVGALQDVGLTMLYKIAGTGETSWSIAASQCDVSYSEWSGFGSLQRSRRETVNAAGSGTAAVACGGTVTPTGASSVLIIGAMSAGMENDTATMSTTPGASITELDDKNGAATNPGRWSGYRITPGAPSGSYAITGTATVSSTGVDQVGITAVFGGGPLTGSGVDLHDPTGLFQVTFDSLLEHRERIEYNGTGSGYLVINRHDPQATAVNLAKGNIVRVTYPEIHVGPVFEWIIEDGDFDLVASDEQGGENLTFSGRGTLALLEQAILGHQNLTDPPRNYNSEGVWRWTSEEWAGIFRRTIQEAQAHTPPALTMLTRDWSDTVDSIGNAFFDMDGSWEIPIGQDLLTIGLDLARAGMGSIEMRPAFLLRAYEGTNQGRDLSGAFGAATVRFEAGINITTEVSRAMAARRWASNVLIHTKDGYLWYSTTVGGDITGTASTDTITSSTAHGLELNDVVMFKVLNGGAGLAVSTRYYVALVPSSTTFKVSATLGGAVLDFTTNITTGSRIIEAPYIKEVLLDLSGTSGTNTQERAAARRLLRGDEASEGVIFEASPVSPAGVVNAPASGWYYPGYQGTDNGKYWVGDLVTFHTGSVAGVDFVAKTMRIQAITLGRDEAGQFAPPIIELNSPWGATTDGTATPSGSSSAAGGGGSAGGSVPAPHVHTQYQPTADKGVASGYASLDVNGRVPAAQLRSWKDPVRVATTATGTLATAYENGDTIDGVVLATGDRILLKDQSAGADNGIYTVNASGAPTRATDFDGSGEVVGALVYVVAGTANAGKVYRNTNTTAPTIGTTALTFAELSGTGSALTVKDEGGTLATGADTLDFTGAGVTASGTGATKTINIPGGGSSISIPDVIQLVQNGNAATSIAITAVPAGNRLIMFTNATTGQVTSPSCTNVTWTQVKTHTGSGAFYAIWVGVVAGGSSGTSITMTKPGSFNTVTVVEVADALTPTLGASTSVTMTSGAAITILNYLRLSGATAGRLVVIATGLDNTGSPLRSFPSIPAPGSYDAIANTLAIGYVIGTAVAVQANGGVGAIIIAELT